MKGDKALNRHPMSPNETTLSCWPKGPNGQPSSPTTQAIFKAIGWSPPIDNGPIVENTYTTHRTQKSQPGAYLVLSPLQPSVHMVLKGTLYTISKEKGKHQPSYKLFYSTMLTCLHDTLVQEWHNACWVTNQLVSDWI